MKKYLLFLLLLTSCKSVTYQDVNPTIEPNETLLPALEAVVDRENLEATYSAGSYRGGASSVGVGGGSDNWGGLTSVTSISGRKYKDTRVKDVIYLFDKEVTENITNPYGKKKGYIALKLGYRETNQQWWYQIPSILSLFSLNVLGFPWNNVNETLEIEVRVMNNKKEMLARYVENVESADYVAVWWGYDERTIYRKVAVDNVKKAMEKIRKRIAKDAPKLKEKLK